MAIRKKTNQKAVKTVRRSRKKVSPYLQDVTPEKSFWVSNGWVIRNLQEMPAALENMSDDTFVYHANNEKNDFSTWIREVVGDKKLAANLAKVKSRKSALTSVNRRLKEL